MNITRRVSMKKTKVLYRAALLLLAAGFIIGSGYAYAAVNPDMGLPMYPGARVNPAYPPINAPHMKNIHLLTHDPLEKVIAWYTQKLGKFDIDRQKKGTQAMWNKDTPDGFFMTVTITTIVAPAGQVEIIMTKMRPVN
jgi:hypothetical protein